ncbi:hypothetical protein Q1695_014058 [Nippostrongylus brasiliensis]|nr:hypothetical protein Q1695_014058 [Nippostrongylus brasiliensis]
MSAPRHYRQRNNKGEDRVNGRETLVQQSMSWFSQNREDRLMNPYVRVMRSAEPQAHYYRQNREDERPMKPYHLDDFPIRMDGTEFLVAARFLVTVHHVNRFNMIFVRVKWRTQQELAMCAVLRSRSPDADIRLAAQECCSNLEQFVNAGATNRHPVSRLSAKFLNDHHILIMDKRSDSFPDAIYWCSLCDYHMNNVQHVRRHFEMHQHFQEEQRLNERKELLKRLPGMSPNQLIAINSLIDSFLHEKNEKERGSMWQQRVQLSNDVCKLLSREVFGKMGFEVQISLYGSVLTKTCIGSSDLNLSIDIPQMDCGDAVETMRQATELLNSTCDVLDAQFSTDVPMCIKFTWSNVCIRVTWRCESGVKFGKFLSVYTAVRPQFAELCRVVRRWAEVSLIYATDRNLGGLASYAFDIMLLYFLQRKGLLPCLHEMRPIISHETDSLPLIDDFYEKRDLYESDIDTIIARIGTPDKPWNLGGLFVEFLSFYGSRLHQNEVVQLYTSKEVNKDRSRWSRKLLQISDPFRTDNVVTFSKAYQAYFFNCFLKSYLYFAIPQTASGPMLDVTLYQKMDESPRKKKTKRRRDRKEPDTPKGTNSLHTKQQENTRKEKLDLSELATVLPDDIDDDEFTAAADELVEEEEARSAIQKEILEDMMPVTPKRSGREDAEGSKSTMSFLNIACISGLDLGTGSSEDDMKQLVAIAEAAKAKNLDIVGCALADSISSLGTSNALPDGTVFFVPPRSVCGFLVSRRWVEYVVDVARLKKGLCGITLMCNDRPMTVIQCVQLCGSSPSRRLQEHLLGLKASQDGSAIVLFGADHDLNPRDPTLTKALKETGLTLWSNLRGKPRNSVAFNANDMNAKVTDIAREELMNSFRNVKMELVRATVQVERSTEVFSPTKKFYAASKAAAKRLGKTMENDERRTERKIKRAERRRLEKERATDVLRQLVKDMSIDEKNPSVSYSMAQNEGEELQFQEGTSVLEGMDTEEAIVCCAMINNEPQTTATQTPRRKARNRKNKKKANSSGDDVEFVIESLLTEVVRHSGPENGDEEREDNHVAGYEFNWETATVHDIPLKNLTPENVEIDDSQVYSRRTMNRIRVSNPTRLPGDVYETLVRFRLATRKFEERDLEAEEMDLFRCEVSRHRTKREKMRAMIAVRKNSAETIATDATDENGEPREDESGDAIQGQSVPCPQSLDVEEAEEPDEKVASHKCYVHFVPSIQCKFKEAPVEVHDQEQRICFEDFFVKLKDFDEQDFKKKIGELDADRFVYSFDDANNFNSGYKPDMVCASCESTGHWADVCPLMKIPTVEAISHEKADYEWSELAEIVWRNFERSRITSDRIDAVGEFVEKMRSHLHQSLNTAIRLNIFGSLNSGFGVAKSDVDICFRFQSVDQPEGVDGVRIVEQIADCLQQMKGVEKVYAITGAKVPIVKFVCPRLGIDGDISYYNVLALSNTELLKTYCAWDKRVAPLGVWIKRWAKMCDIGDASHGSLSSYAYIILLLHYLQNCDPPLVPRLQEDFRSADTQPEIIENCDVYFHKDVIEGWSRNRQTLGELFIGFLDYYARFDFGTQVVQIRRKKPLLKIEKEWNRSLCIEDPFDLRHNLGSGITKKMFVFIVRNIHNSRKRFMLSECRKAFLEGRSLAFEKQMPPSLCDDYATLVLQDCQMGSAPSDRQCRICHCIGHFADSCQKAAQRTPRRGGEKWNKRVAVSNENTPQRVTPHGGHVFGTRSNAVIGERVFYRVSGDRFHF